MPVLHLPASKPECFPALRAALARELLADQKPSSEPSSAPLVVEETDLTGRSLHVSVVWNEWESVARAERGTVIAEAYREAFGEAKAATIRLALGLTWAEAGELGISDMLRGETTPGQ